MSKVYMVYFDGYMDDYGMEMYLLGIYDSKEKAEEAVQTLPDAVKNDDECWHIAEATVNNTLKVEAPDFLYDDTYVTDIYLGGYKE